MKNKLIVGQSFTIEWSVCKSCSTAFLVTVTKHVKCLESACLGLFCFLHSLFLSFFLSPGPARVCLGLTDAESNWHLMEHCPDSLWACLLVCVCEHVLTLHMLKRAKDQRDVTRLWQRSSKRLIWKCSPWSDAPTRGMSSSQGYSRDSSVIGEC